MGNASRAECDRTEVRQSTAQTLRLRSEARGIPPGHFKKAPEALGFAVALEKLIDPYIKNEMTLEERRKVVTWACWPGTAPCCLRGTDRSRSWRRWTACRRT